MRVGLICRPTTPARRRDRRRRDRSSGAWRRSRRACFRPGCGGDEHLAVVAAGDDRRRRRSPPRECRRHGWRKPLLVVLAGDQQHRLLAEHEGRSAVEEMRGDHRRAGRDRAGALDDGRGVAERWSEYRHACCHRSSPRKREPRSPMLGLDLSSWVPACAGTTDFGATASIIPSGDRRLKTLADFVFRQIAADEHELAVARLAVLPGALVVAVEDHVHALEHEAVGIVLEIEDALAAQDRRAVLGDKLLDPGEELVGVERLSVLIENDCMSSS